MIFQRDVHRIFSDHDLSLCSGHILRIAAPKDLEGLVVLVQFEHNEDRPGTGGESVGGSDGNDFMGPLEAQFFIEPFGEHDVTKHAFGWGVEIVRLGALGTILKVGDRDVVGEGKLFGPQEGAGEKNDGTGKRTH
ncbi:MAG: hypothetical protein LZF60_90083 [Nitrospira sp.]|nr:MAG: hypothetical protein LZF60_90083 [Nitrospira sp.]